MQVTVKELEKAAIRFCGDSGDGMQLTGTLFSTLSAVFGNEISTFPDYPAEMRAPQGSLSGVSGYQVHIGSTKTYTPGDKADVLIAMNPAALKTNIRFLKRDSVVVIDEDTFNTQGLEKAEFKTDDPFKELQIENMQIVPVPISSLTKASLEGSGLDNKSILRCKNMFALGFTCWLFNKPLDEAERLLGNKFGKKPSLLQANLKVMTDGYNYGHNIHASVSTYSVNPSHLEKGIYTDVKGNQATAWGLIAASEKSGRPLFLGSYPITPATDILHELAARKELGVKTVQAEDEIAGVCTAIGASFAGHLAATSTSGPGIALKSEAIGLAVMAELPLVVIDVQRGGPSTGLPTKAEQTDLLQAIYGRNGESPCVVIAASTPANCFDFAFQAGKIALEHMTPVILMTDAFLANGSSAWKIPNMDDYPTIHPPFVPEELRGKWTPYMRQAENFVRYWALPGREGFAHRIGGLEKDANTGAISTDPANHELMCQLRQKKVNAISEVIPPLEVQGDPEAEVLVVGWGGTFGHLHAAVEDLNKEGHKTALAHFNYINPLPKNTAEVFSRYKKIVVCELNNGQFASFLRSKLPSGIEIQQFNKIQAQPFTVKEVYDAILTQF